MGEKKRPKILLISYWKQIVMWLLAIAFVASVLVFKLDSLVPGVSSSELNTFSRSQNIETILNNPFNALYLLTQYGLHLGDIVSVQSLRLISATLGLIMTALMFYVIKQWYTVRLALLISVLFGSSAWLLHHARLATPVVMQLSLIIALAYGVWLRRTSKKTLAVLLGVLLIVWFIYIPGFVWFVLVAVIWQRKVLTKLMQRTPVWGVMVSYILGVVLLAPLVRAIILEPQLLKSLAGLPLGKLPSIVDIAKNLVSVPKNLFIHGPNDATVWLGGLPLLNVFSAAMLVLGSYSLYFKRKLDSTKFIYGGLALGTLLVGLGVVNVIVLMPLLYVIMAAGLALLLQQWFTVFPNNPLARTLGSLLVAALVGITVFFHLNQYFIAWPKAPATKAAFTSELE
jgi:hypothetical protein